VNDELLAMYSGYDLPAPLDLPGNVTVTVAFASDYSVTDQGFALLWSAGETFSSPPSPPPPSPPSPPPPPAIAHYTCGSHDAAWEFQVGAATTLNSFSGEHTGNNVECTLDIYAPEVSLP
jgi:hypothetical protein